MTYCDFIIQKEHKFLRNVLSKDDLSKSNAIETVESFHENFKKFLRICIFADNAIKTYNEFEDCPHNELIDFLKENLEIESFNELKEKISETKVKSTSKIPKFKIQIYAFFLQ